MCIKETVYLKINFMKSVGFSVQLLYIKFYSLIRNLLQAREPCKVFQIHTFHVALLRNLLFPLNCFCSMPPLSGSSSFPYISHLEKNWISEVIIKQKSFQRDILEVNTYIKVTTLIFLTFVDLTGIFIIDYKKYINIYL